MKAPPLQGKRREKQLHTEEPPQARATTRAEQPPKGNQIRSFLSQATTQAAPPHPDPDSL